LQTVGEVWERLPRDRERAARLLGAGRFRAFVAGTLPSLAPAIAQAASLCFLLCFFSFAVVMVFGGLAGSTLEVEVYRLSRFEADPSAASALALAETVIAIVVVSASALFERASSRGIASARAAGSSPELAKPRGAALAALAAYGVFLAFFLGGPLLSLAIQAFSERGGPFGPARAGIGNFARLFASSGSSFARAAGGTLSTALPAAAIAALLGCAGAFGLRRGGAAAGAIATLPLAVSGIVASLGWSLLLPAGGPFLISIVQALGAMPYVLRPVAAALATLEAGPARAARTLGATRFRAALEVELPAVGPTVLAAAAFAFVASAGDMTAPLALARGSFETIPLYLYRLTSSYRFPEACAAGLVLSLAGAAAFAVGRGGSGGKRRGDA
ncbi:MAG: ABC transporter permease subunit, partial [Spirochaetaceae bacterium]|nr:ABC transporter permease subunit [Spirochaetaceae bacterium]